MNLQVYIFLILHIIAQVYLAKPQWRLFLLWKKLNAFLLKKKTKINSKQLKSEQHGFNLSNQFPLVNWSDPLLSTLREDHFKTVINILLLSRTF